MKMSLRDISNAIGSSIVLEGYVDKISTDSRDIDENTLFIALKGERFDANVFVPEVLEKGAKAVVCSHYDGKRENVLLCKDTGEALLQIAKKYRESFNIPFVALTGSVGKTTTKGMIYAVLSSKFNTLRTEGNLNNEIGVPKTLFCLEEDHQAAVIEMGMNHFGEISRLTRTVKPQVGVITNVGTAHIENLGSREGILKAKCEILEGMAEDAPLIVNGDNDMLSTLKFKDRPLIRFGIDSKNDMYAEDIEQSTLGSEFTAVYGNERAYVFVPAVGIHNVYNALCAMCVGISLGFTLKEAASGVKYFQSEGMRQKITSVRGMTFVEDCYNANPDSMCASLETLKTLKVRRTVAVLGDMLELGDFSKEAHTSVGEKAAQTECDLILTLGNEAKYIAQGANEKGATAISFTDKEKITQYLYENLKEGDTVLFKGSRGMRMEEIFNDLYKEWKK